MRREIPHVPNDIIQKNLKNFLSAVREVVNEQVRIASLADDTTAELQFLTLQGDLVTVPVSAAQSKLVSVATNTLTPQFKATISLTIPAPVSITAMYRGRIYLPYSPSSAASSNVTMIIYKNGVAMQAINKRVVRVDRYAYVDVSDIVVINSSCADGIHIFSIAIKSESAALVVSDQAIVLVGAQK